MTINNEKKVKGTEFTFYGFTCDSRMDYFTDAYKADYYEKSGRIDKINYGVFDRRGGCRSELVMAWHLVDGKPTPRLEVFSDYFEEAAKPWHIKLMRQITKLGKSRFTPDELSRILISLGFEDESDIKLI